MTVYLLWHVHQLDNDDDEKLIGIYSSPATANAAIARLRTQPGFRDLPEGFEMEAYELDEDHWTEGFVTVR
jgi:homoserine kinase type II